MEGRSRTNQGFFQDRPSGSRMGLQQRDVIERECEIAGEIQRGFDHSIVLSPEGAGGWMAASLPVFCPEVGEG